LQRERPGERQRRPAILRETLFQQPERHEIAFKPPRPGDAIATLLPALGLENPTFGSEQMSQALSGIRVIDITRSFDLKAAPRTAS